MDASVAPATSPTSPEVSVESPLVVPSDQSLSDGGTSDNAATGDLAALAPLRGVVDVTIAGGRRTRRGVEDGDSSVRHVFEGRVLIPAMSLDRIVFETSTADPHGCCADIGPGSLDFRCEFSGIDLIRTNGRITRDGDALVVHWSTVDASTGQVSDRGDMRRPLAHGARLRFHTRLASCSVPAHP